MATRHLPGVLSAILAALLLASGVACGSSRPSAQTSQDVSACTGCHGNPPTVGAHVAHVAGTAGATHAAEACLQCHVDVKALGTPGHILSDVTGKPNPPPAVVRFDQTAAGAIAGLTVSGGARGGPPSYDATAKTCSNVYCHGAGLKGAPPAGLTTPAFDAPAGSVACGACHANPPANHPASLALADCATCHGDAIDAAGVPSAAKHVNGVVDLAPNVAATSSCAACHGDASARAAAVPPGDPRSAPPTDAAGSAASAAVGAHQAHVNAGALGPAVACDQCHAVPSTLLAAGHLDHVATVTFGSVANKYGGASYDKATQTCSNVYCHGNIQTQLGAAPAGPTWGAGSAAVACGSCHGLPPAAPAHPAVNVNLQGCNNSTVPALQCHPAAFTPTTVDPKLHIDGRTCPPFCDEPQ